MSNRPATKADIQQAFRRLATKDELREAASRLATTDELREAVSRLATTDELQELKVDFQRLAILTVNNQAAIVEMRSNMVTKADHANLLGVIEALASQVREFHRETIIFPATLSDFRRAFENHDRRLRALEDRCPPTERRPPDQSAG